jgi:hypothetical protein
MFLEDERLSDIFPFTPSQPEGVFISAGRPEPVPAGEDVAEECGMGC